MNDWMCPDLKWDDNYVPDRGKVLDEGRDREAREIPSLSRRRRRRHPVPHAARRASQGRVFHARLGPHAVRRVHRGLGRIPDRARPPDAQVPHGEAAGAEGHHRAGPEDRHRAWWPTAAPTARCARRATSSPRTASRPTTCACARSRSARTWRSSSRRTSWCSSSSRTATRRCARCSRSRRACREAEAALAAALQRPADFLRVHRQGRARRGRTQDPQARSGAGAGREDLGGAA